MRITTQSHFLFPFQDYIVPKSKASFFRALFLAFSSFFKMYCENTPDFLSLRYVIMILLFPSTISGILCWNTHAKNLELFYYEL